MAETKEPTMEEILASIRRIISEEGEAAPETGEAERPQPAAQPEPASQQSIDDIFDEVGDEDDDVLELTESVEAPASAAYQPELPPMTAPLTESLVSEQTVAATTQTLHSLSGLLVRNYPGSENTLEGLVREMLRPMLKEWLDANLPEIVERTVAREVARITGRVAGE